ncbi:hypothetical protein ULG90_20930 [Halopseudomonas pachastrellae]|nr:hypothetical protein ULG90_20930 [Halopseudomonas pachastrellae]
MQLHKLLQVVVVKRIGFAQTAAGVELVVPHFLSGLSFCKEEHHGFDAGAQEGFGGAVEHGVQVVVLQQLFAQGDGGVVVLLKKVFLITTAARPPGLRIFIKCCRNRKAVSPVLMGKFCCTLCALCRQGRVVEDDVVLVAGLYVLQVFRQRVGVDHVGGFYAVQDHVHDGDDVGEGLLLLGVEGPLAYSGPS